MSQTLKEYMTEPYNKIIDDTTPLDETMQISEFLQELDQTQKRTNFTSPAHYKSLASKPHGLIALKTVFDPDLCYDEEGHPEEFVDDLNDFLEAYGDWEVTETDNGDNTYNYAANIEADINVNQVTIANPNSNTFESKDLAFMKVNTGVDPRAGYTDNVIVIFNNDYGEHYDATLFWNTSFTVATGTFNYNNENYFFDFHCRLNEDSYYVTISADNFDKIVNVLDDEFDPADFDDDFDIEESASIKQCLQNLMNKLLKGDQKIEKFELKYISECDD